MSPNTKRKYAQILSSYQEEIDKVFFLISPEGKMNIKDLIEVLKLSHLNDHIEKIKESFNHVDKDRDNYINKEEFIELLNFLMMNKTKEEKMKNAFLMLDKDGDSKITLNDLRDIMNQLEYTNITDEELNEMINVHGDEKGYINEDDFKLLYEHLENESDMTKRKRNLEQSDIPSYNQQKEKRRKI